MCLLLVILLTALCAESVFIYYAYKNKSIAQIKINSEKITESWLSSNGYKKIKYDALTCWIKDNAKYHIEFNQYDGTYTYVDNRNKVYGISKIDGLNFIIEFCKK